MASNTPESTTTQAAPKANNGAATAAASKPAACPNCGAEIGNGSTYCGDCGCVFSADTVAAAATHAATLPDKVKSYEFEKLLTGAGETCSALRGKIRARRRPCRW